jgi:hypothetical protein
MEDRFTNALWRGHRRRLEGQIMEYAGMLRAIEGRLLRLRGRARRATGDAQEQVSAAIERLEVDYRKIAEGWQAVLKTLDNIVTSGRESANSAIARADAVLSERPGLLTIAAKALRRARVEAAVLRKGVQVGLRRGRRMAAVASRRRAARSKT